MPGSFVTNLSHLGRDGEYDFIIAGGGKYSGKDITIRFIDTLRRDGWVRFSIPSVRGPVTARLAPGVRREVVLQSYPAR